MNSPSAENRSDPTHTQIPVMTHRSVGIDAWLVTAPIR